MTRPAPLSGLRLRLRPVELSDASYIYGLRTDSRYNLHLSAVTGTADDQRAWIERYLLREAGGCEVYFVIERLVDAQPCGAVRLYDIGTERFTWGSWILDTGKPAKAALESAVLVYDFGFGAMGLQYTGFEVRKDNHRTLSFHRRFGATETGEDDVNLYFIYTRSRFLADRPRHWTAITEEVQA